VGQQDQLLRLTLPAPHLRLLQQLVQLLTSLLS
jgi:hypothetical protein